MRKCAELIVGEEDEVDVVGKKAWRRGEEDFEGWSEQSFF